MNNGTKKMEMKRRYGIKKEIDWNYNFICASILRKVLIDDDRDIKREGMKSSFFTSSSLKFTIVSS